MRRSLVLMLAACAASIVPASPGAQVIRELFDGMTPSLVGAGDTATSIGFESGTTWAGRADSIKAANNFNVNPNVGNQMPVLLGANGGLWWSTGTDNWGTTWWATRQLAASAQLNMNVDGVYYITYNMRRRNDTALGFGFASGSAATSQFFSVGATWNTTGFNPSAARRLVVAQGTLNVGQGPYGASAYSATQVNNDDRNLILIKITTSAAGNDTIQAAFFNASRSGYTALPATEAGVTWDVTHSVADVNTYTHLLAYMNGGTGSAELDAFRMGTTYGDVVQVAPLITQQAAISPSASVFTGMAVSMNVTASGPASLPLTYQWFKDGGAITDATNAAFSIASAVLADAGAYHVVVANVNGSVSSITNTLVVSEAAPAVVAEARAGTRYVGGRFTFAPVISGSQPIQFQWKRDGVDLPGATSSTLNLNNLQATDSGAYVLAATNALGGIETTPVSLTVITPAADSYEEFIMMNQPVAYWRYNDTAPGIAQDVAGGNDATNNAVSYSTGVSQPTFPGFPADNTAGVFDGVSSASVTGARLMNNRSQFTIIGWFNPATMPQTASGGRVALFGQNDAAELGFHGNTALGIWTPGGGFVSFNPTTVITPGNWYMLAGVGDGTNVTFYLNGDQMVRGGNATTNYGSSTEPFRIGSAVLDATGNFFNGMIDEVSVFDRALPLNVLNALYAKAAGAIAPTVTASPANLTLFAGQTARFRVSATGTLPINYYWLRDNFTMVDGGNVSGANTAELVITGITDGDAGNYMAALDNAAGWDDSDPALLTIIPRPTDAFSSMVLSNGPVSWWRLNEAAGSTVAYDYVGGRNGTYGAASVAGIAGPETPTIPAGNTAVQTGPAGSAVSLPALNVDSNVMTISAWIYSSGAQGGFRGIVFSREAGTVAGLHFGNGDELRYSWNDASATWGWDSGLVVPSNQWCYAVLVITPTNGTIYLGADGQVRSAVNNTAHAVQGFAGSTLIGQDPTGDRTFSGNIDEVAIYNRALSSLEVHQLYLGTVAQSLTVRIERSTDVVADSKTSGEPHDAQNINATWLPSDGTGADVRSGVISFPSATNTQVRLPASSDFNSPTGTISFWVRSTFTTAGNGAVMLDRRTSNGDIIGLQSDGAVFIQPEQMYYATSTKRVNDGLWHHIAYVYDQSASGSINVYIDGVLEISRPNTRAWSWPASQQIELARSHDTYWQQYEGSLDDLRIYNVPMTANEVVALMADQGGEPASALKVRLNFDEAPAGALLHWGGGNLEAATAVQGPYLPIPGAASPWPVSTTGAGKFFRAVVR